MSQRVNKHDGCEFVISMYQNDIPNQVRMIIEPGMVEAAQNRNPEALKALQFFIGSAVKALLLDNESEEDRNGSNNK